MYMYKIQIANVNKQYSSQQQFVNSNRYKYIAYDISRLYISQKRLLSLKLSDAISLNCSPSTRHTLQPVNDNSKVHGISMTMTEIDKHHLFENNKLRK